MYRTFNMGTGIIIAVNKTHSDEICTWLRSKIKGVEIIGSVVDNGHKVTHQIPEVEFTHY